MTERKRFFDRLERDRQAGLVEFKPLFWPKRSHTPEEIFGFFNEIEDAIDAGRCIRHGSWNGNEPSTVME